MADESTRIDAATKWLGKQSKKKLRGTTEWDVVRNFFLRSRDAGRLLNAELLKRGIITIADLSPPERRALVDPNNVDLHALAAGPIMDSNEIFLPAGKLSMAETIAREQAMLIEARL